MNKLLKIAVTAGVETAVKIHIRRGDDLNARDEQGLTPLMIAASRNRPHICKLLIDTGVNVDLTTSSGLDALQIAINVGSKECESYIRAAKEKVLIPKHSVSNNAVLLFDFSENDNNSLVTESTWEPETTPTAPVVDNLIIDAALKLNDEISRFVPIDTYEDWKDFETYLPEKSADIQNEINDESNFKLRMLFCLAFKEGRIPSNLIDDVLTQIDQTNNSAFVNAVEFTLTDIGVQKEESVGLDECFTQNKETDEADDEVSEALEFLRDVLSTRNHSISHYYREASKFKLINGDEEVYLAKQMEECLDEAINILSTWQDGINYLFSSIELLRDGLVDLESITTGRSIDASPTDFDGESELDSSNIQNSLAEEIESEDEVLLDDIEQSSASREFLSICDNLEDLIRYVDWAESSNLKIEELLKKLSLSRVFLIKLASEVNDTDPAISKKESFSKVMSRYETARNKMILSNLRLVSSIAMRYSNFGLNLEDLIQEGNLGLMKAVDRYDWRRGFKLSTYATWWIKQSVTRAIADKAKTIRLPVHICEVLNRMRKLIEIVGGQSGKPVKVGLIASRLDIQPKKVEHLMQFIEEPLSLSDSENDEIRTLELLEDDISPDPFVTVAIKNLHDTFEKLFSDLEPNQEKILRLRFGFDTGEPLTLEEIGAQFGVTRERIRQIEAKALKKMSAEIRSQLLEPFLDLDFSRVKQKM